MTETIHLVVILHNIRSAHNVGSMFRTADGAGFSKIFLTGYTPLPPRPDALYLTRAEKDLAKTALGAEQVIPWEHADTLVEVVSQLKDDDYEIVALEQSERSVMYDRYIPVSSEGKVALLVGAEVDGLAQDELALADRVIEIPMQGTKESLNVSVAFGIAAYQITGTMNTENKEAEKS